MFVPPGDRVPDAKQLLTIESGELEVTEHHVHRLFEQELQAAQAIGGFQDAIDLIRGLQRFPDLGAEGTSESSMTRIVAMGLPADALRSPRSIGRTVRGPCPGSFRHRWKLLARQREGLPGTLLGYSGWLSARRHSSSKSDVPKTAILGRCLGGDSGLERGRNDDGALEPDPRGPRAPGQRDRDPHRGSLTRGPHSRSRESRAVPSVIVQMRPGYGGALKEGLLARPAASTSSPWTPTCRIRPRRSPQIMAHRRRGRGGHRLAVRRRRKREDVPRAGRC